MKFGIYIYQINDGITSLQPKINSLFGLDQALKSTDEYYNDRKENFAYTGENEYTNLLRGKNIIVIHAESMQTVNIDREFNGIEVT